MITFIEEGDIFTLNDINNYAHGCNCAGAMGKGIALQFKSKFPEMYKEYKELCSKGLFNPGDVYDYTYPLGHVYNLGTQETWRTRAQISYIEQSLYKMMSKADKDNVKKIALPAIGAGLGGLKWDEIKYIFQKTSEMFPNTDLYVVERYKKE